MIPLLLMLVMAQSPSASPVEMTMSGAQGKTVLYNAGDKLMEIYDKGGKLTVAVYRDGHVVAADQTKIDAAATEFWQLMAKHAASVCKGAN